VATLRLALGVLLRLFAPVVPYITEEVWSWAFAEQTGQTSIHRAPWPTTGELAAIPLPSDPDSFELACSLYAALNKKKTECGASVGRVVTATTIAASPALLARIAPALEDVLAAAKVKAQTLAARESLAETDGFVIEAIEIAPKEARSEEADASG
jgi:valyl-tRNA synthetase